MTTSFDALVAALGGLQILWWILLLFLFIAPLAIWVHTARTAAAVRKHTQLLERIADAQDRIATCRTADGIAPAAEGAPKYKRCPSCGAVRALAASVCDLCGYAWRTTTAAASGHETTVLEKLEPRGEPPAAAAPSAFELQARAAMGPRTDGDPGAEPEKAKTE